jgi:hypothetical protein
VIDRTCRAPETRIDVKPLASRRAASTLAAASLLLDLVGDPLASDYLLLDLNRERNEERRALPYKGLQPDFSAMHFDDVLGDRKTKTGAAFLARDLIIGLLELLE